MSESRRQFALRSGIVQRLGVLADGLLDECLPVLGAVELNAVLSEDIVDGNAVPEQSAENRRPVVAPDSAGVDVLHQIVISHVPFADVCCHGRHSIDHRSHIHKSNLPLTHPQTTARAQTSQSYNTLGTIEVTKRSTSFLGNVPGNVPGWPLGLTRSAKTSMNQYESLHQEATGGTAPEPLADARRAA